MLYAFGTGEAPITIASKGKGYTVRTVRTVGDAVKQIDQLREGDSLYWRGPYRNIWNLQEAYGKILLILFLVVLGLLLPAGFSRKLQKASSEG